jgi:ATP phosphoribosyltransferase regulatory subunit
LCYCGPVLHTRPDRPHATREPLQLGAEIYGHSRLARPIWRSSCWQLALACLKAAEVAEVTVDLADARVIRSLLEGLSLDRAAMVRIHAALASKDASELRSLTRGFPAAVQESLMALINLYGGAEILSEAQMLLKPSPMLREALSNLQWIASRLPKARVTFDLADLRGYSYYSGARFAIYAKGASDALVRGGRYDEVGAVFGRTRPAAGFSLDIKELVPVIPVQPLRAAIRAPWGDGADLRDAILGLRKRGETVVCVLPGHESEIDEFNCDRELVHAAGQWVVKAI